MKIAAPPSPPLPAPAAGAAPRGQDRGQFQQLVQQLEHDMWSGAAAGGAPGAAPEPRAAPRSPRAQAAPAVVRPLAHLRDPALPPDTADPPRRYDLRDIVEAAATPLAAATPASEGANKNPAFAAFVAQPPTPARASAAANADATAETAAAFAPATPQREEPAAERLSLLAAPGGFGVALRLREDRPLDPDLLKRALARVLHEHGASLMRLTINGTDASLFQGETRHGD